MGGDSNSTPQFREPKNHLVVNVMVRSATSVDLVAIDSYLKGLDFYCVYKIKIKGSEGRK